MLTGDSKKGQIVSPICILMTFKHMGPYGPLQKSKSYTSLNKAKCLSFSLWVYEIHIHSDLKICEDPWTIYTYTHTLSSSLLSLLILSVLLLSVFLLFYHLPCWKWPNPHIRVFIPCHKIIRTKVHSRHQVSMGLQDKLSYILINSGLIYSYIALGHQQWDAISNSQPREN